MTPVPLPTAETVNLVPPDAAETQALADGIASIVAGSEGLLPVQRSLLESMFPAMTGFHVTAGRRPARRDAGGVRGAAGEARVSFRARIVQNMLLCALVRHPIPDDVAENVARVRVRARRRRGHGPGGA